ncbi:hypothetical protein FBEOM_3408 [Fusarium beomiforme]|uniref:Uncharacterized protein n=1 Tax=Fusarium beomiforme TaxID=44412 RepID=A0A9P5APR7_9HYPO|nr:hypothetical protein FBEOM_3408 [Fusarium beomiforme]
MRILEGLAGITTTGSLAVSVTDKNGLQVPCEFRGFFLPLRRTTEPMLVQLKYGNDTQLQTERYYRFDANAANGKFEMTMDSGIKIKSHDNAKPVPDISKISGWGKWTKVEPMVQPVRPGNLGSYMSLPSYVAYHHTLWRNPFDEHIMRW